MPERLEAVREAKGGHMLVIVGAIVYVLVFFVLF